MFAPDGYYSLYDFSKGLFSAVYDPNDRPTPESNAETSPQEKLNRRLEFGRKMRVAFSEAAWSFLDGDVEIGVLSSSGAVVLASHSLLDYYDPTSERGTYVDLLVGTVGSGGYESEFTGFDVRVPLDIRFSISKDEAERERIQKMTRLFGPFLYCPILVPAREATDFVESVRLDSAELVNDTVVDGSEYSMVWRCVQEAFPNGKGSATWTAIEEKVGYSRRHIVRAVKSNTDYETWARGGHMR